MDRRSFLQTAGVTAGAGAVGFSIAARQGTETLAADGIEGEIELLTDEHDVTHVYAQSLKGVAYGQGYAQARDRLFQMEVFRTIGHGESSEVVGPSQLSTDIDVKRDLYNEDEILEQWETARDDTVETIEGYTEGVNAKIDEMEQSGNLPGELTLLGRELERWEPTDTVAALSYMIGIFGVSGGSERSSAKTLLSMFEHVEGEADDKPDSFESREAAWAAYSDFNRVVVPEDHTGSLRASEVPETDGRTFDYDEVPDAQWDAIEAVEGVEDWSIDEESGLASLFSTHEPSGLLEGLKFGSNGIVVDGRHTETGEAMLGGGPQMSLLKPPAIHEIGLHGPDFDVTGVGVVGTPGVVIGRTPEFAWTVTTGRDDAIDTIAVELDPEDRYRYKWDGEFHEFATERYTHEPNAWGGIVEGNVAPETVEQEVAYVEQEGTRMPVVAYNPEENIAFVERVSTRMDELEGAFMWADIGRANSREEFEESLSEFPFGFNFLFADSEGIGHYRTAKMPNRNHSADPRFPVPAEHHEWEGTTVGEELGVWEDDPERGYVVNWNNAPAPGWRNADGEFQWEGAQRVDVLDRITQGLILDSDEEFSLEEFETDPLPEDAVGAVPGFAAREIPADASGNLSQRDVKDIIEEGGYEHPFAPRMMPHFVAAARESDDDTLQAVADELETWAFGGGEGPEPGLEAWTEYGDLERWFETEYRFHTFEDRYPNGGVAIYEEASNELLSRALDDHLGDQAPEFVYNPRAGDALSGSVDPHAADHGSGGGPQSLLIDALEGRSRYPWLGETRAQRHEALRESLSAAADRLSERFDSDEPSDWRRDVHKSEFFPLGGAALDTITISNRSSYQQSVAIGQGAGAERDAGESVLPPSNTAHLDIWELVETQLGEEPDRLTDQLDIYAQFDYKPNPVTREAVEQRVDDERSIN